MLNIGYVTQISIAVVLKSKHPKMRSFSAFLQYNLNSMPFACAMPRIYGKR
jgi:hypothetical protein